MRKFVKYFLFCYYFIFLRQTYSVAQISYPIGVATIQPEWVFPLFLEDAHGQRDTIYFGYDHSASPGQSQQDFQFGEFNYFIDSITMIGGSMHPFPDSIQKVLILSDSALLVQGIQWPFSIYNVYLPLIIRYDKSTLYSNAIPFSDQTPLPRAQGILNWYYFPNYIDCGFDQVIITDTLTNIPSGGCQKQDSLIIENSSGNSSKENIFFTFGISPWIGYVPLGLNDQNSFKKSIVFPNPAVDQITLRLSDGDYEYEIYNLLGRKMNPNTHSSKRSEIQIDISEWNGGIYFIRVYDGNLSFQNYFIINK